MVNSTFTLQPQQIVYLEHCQTRLFAELIQFAEIRQTYWVRPLMLVEFLVEVDWPQHHPGNRAITPWEFANSSSTIYDLRHAPDLLWPARAFQAAIDTDIIECLTYLYTLPLEHELSKTAHHHLQQFMARLWQAQSAA